MMNTPRLHAAASGSPERLGTSSLETPEESRHEERKRYCPTALLASFALLMAGHGRCVHTDMMLGDREYAMWQLACAKATDDAELVAVADRLFAYFDDPHHTGTPVLGTA